LVSRKDLEMLVSLAFCFLSSASLVMIVAHLLRAYGVGTVWLGLGLGGSVAAVGDFNNPPGVDIWCGKAYKATVLLICSIRSAGKTY